MKMHVYLVLSLLCGVMIMSMNTYDSELLLKRAAFKLDYGDGIFAYAIYRPVAYLILKALRNRRVNPNKITLLAMTLYTLAGGVLIIEYAPQSGLASNSLRPIQEFLVNADIFGLNLGIIMFLLLYNFALILDCLDGSIARYFGISSAMGRMLDCFSDSVGHLFIMVGLILMLPEYSPLIASLFFLYYALALTYLSYMFELVKVGRIPDEFVKPIIQIGDFKILVGTLDNFVMGINLIFIFQALNLNLGLYLLLLNIFWGFLLFGLVLSIGLLGIEITK